jgi:pimeloyl-ACP methyl ester carboxylesterase
MLSDVHSSRHRAAIYAAVSGARTDGRDRRMREAEAMPRRKPETLRIPLRDGRALSGRSWPGEGIPIVLLHGLLDSCEGWDDFCRRTQHPCLALDLPGFGGSDLPTRPSLRAYAEDVAAALDHLRVRRFVLAGHSLGGGVAAALAEQRPRATAALVLLAPTGFGRIALAEAISLPGVRNVGQLLLPVALGNRAALRAAYRFLVSTAAAPDDVIARVVDHHGELVPGAREATKAIVRAGLSRNGFRHRVMGYRGPVTVVWGDRDRLVPRGHLAGVAAAFPDAHAEVWPGMAHHPQLERPRELAALVDRVCRSVEAPPAGRAAAA